MDVNRILEVTQSAVTVTQAEQGGVNIWGYDSPAGHQSLRLDSADAHALQDALNAYFKELEKKEPAEESEEDEEEHDCPEGMVWCDDHQECETEDERET